MNTRFVLILPAIMWIVVTGVLHSGVRDLLEDKSLADCVASIAETYFPKYSRIDATTEDYVYQKSGEYSLGLENEVYKKLQEVRKFKLHTFITTGRFSMPDRYLGIWNKASGYRPQAYVVMLRKNATKNNLVEQLHVRFGHLQWLPRERWLVTLRNESQLVPVLNKLTTARVSHGLVLFQRPGFGGDVEVYSWSMSTSVGHRCWQETGRPVLLDRWSAEKKRFILGTHLYADRRPKGCHLVVEVEDNPPYVIETIESVGGLEPKILSLVAEQLNFTVQYKRVKKNSPLSWKVINLWNGDTDLLINGLDCNQGFFPNAEYSFFYLVDTINLYVPSGERNPPWESLVAEFSMSVWLLVLAVWLVVSACIMRRNILLAWAVMLENGTGGESVLNPFLALYVYYCLFVQTAYKSSLVSFMVDPGYIRPLGSIEEVVSANLTICMPSFSSIVIQLSELIVEYKFFDHKSNFMEDCLNETAFQRTSASLASTNFVSYWKPKYYTKNNRDLIKVVDDNGARIAENICTYFSTAFPLYKELDRELSQIIEAGFLTKWSHEVYSTLKDSSDHNVILTTYHLTAAFLVFTIGNALAFIVFVGEFLSYYIYRTSMRSELIVAT